MVAVRKPVRKPVKKTVKKTVKQTGGKKTVTTTRSARSTGPSPLLMATTIGSALGLSVAGVLALKNIYVNDKKNKGTLTGIDAVNRDFINQRNNPSIIDGSKLQGPLTKYQTQMLEHPGELTLWQKAFGVDKAR